MLAPEFSWGRRMGDCPGRPGVVGACDYNHKRRVREIIIISAFGWMRMQGASEPLLWKLITADDCFDESADTCSTTTSIYGVAYM